MFWFRLAAFKDELRAQMSTVTCAELERAVDEFKFPCAIVTKMDELHESDAVKHSAIFVEREAGRIGHIREPLPAPRYENTPAGVGGNAPEYDEHTEEILRGVLGMDAGEIEQLRSAGALCGGPV